MLSMSTLCIKHNKGQIMKTLLLSFALMAVASTMCNAQACTIKLVKKKASSKTSYTLKGESISESVIAKLKSQCSFKVRLMTNQEKATFDIARLKIRLAKLQGKRK